ncbi:MAG TPA: hypothetical protein PLO51_00870, partial [Candidatus Micrarchaeota archaeon]|nr:hypothetical protein [Candidatus Micrarchaeota archaeon]
MKEHSGQLRPIPFTPVNTPKLRNIKTRIPIVLKVIVPLAATIMMFQSCAGSSQKQVKTKGDDSVLTFQTSKLVFK